MEELAGRPEAGAALEVAALLRRTWAGARASEAEVRGAHVPIGGSAAHACGWRSACLCACGQRRDAHHRAAIGGRKHLAVGRPGGPGERAGSMPCGAAPATPTTERRCGGGGASSGRRGGGSYSSLNLPWKLVPITKSSCTSKKKEKKIFFSSFLFSFALLLAPGLRWRPAGPAA